MKVCTQACSLICAVAFIATPVATQAASYTIFGAACKPTIAPPLPLANVNLPKIGSTLVLRTTGSWSNFAASGLTIVMTGASHSAWGAVKLPFDLRTLSVVGFRFYCPLYVSPDLPLVVPYRQGPAAPFDLQLPIPNSRGLLGVRFFQQAHMILMGIGETESIASQGGDGTIGL